MEMEVPRFNIFNWEWKGLGLGEYGSLGEGRGLLGFCSFAFLVLRFFFF